MGQRLETLERFETLESQLKSVLPSAPVLPSASDGG